MSLRLIQVRYSYFTYMHVLRSYLINIKYSRVPIPTMMFIFFVYLFICFYFSLYKMATIAINALDARVIWGVDDESRPKLIKAVPNQCDSLLSCHVRPISSIKNG